MTAETTMDCAIAVACRGRLVSGATDAPSALWWSFGKTVLAAAALALVRDGRLDLDAPMPEQNFTLAEALGHRAGLPDYGGMPRYRAAVAAGETPWTADEFLARTGADNLRWPERGTFHYSNIGYLLVRRLIETTTGATLQAALERLVFDPLDIGGVHVLENVADVAATLWGNSQNYDGIVFELYSI